MKVSRRSAGIVAGIIVLVCAVFAILLNRAEPLARDRIIRLLEDRFDSDVELGSINLSLFPQLSISGERVVIRHKHRTDVPPLIQVRRFRADANIFSMIFKPRRVSRVRVEGLEIHVPPRQDGSGEKPVKEEKAGSGSTSPIVVRELIADGTVLKVLSKDPAKEPLTFDIHQLTMRNVGLNDPMPFEARLRNAKPPGDIVSTGKFGPWSRDEPGLTPVSGKYTFANANLGVFKGISGTLSSEGEYTGRLNRIEVRGWTDTPDFAVTISGNPVHLKTNFNAVVDGTNGDTYLLPVNARILRSGIHAQGGVYGRPPQKGKTVALDVSVAEGRIEDLLRLALKSKEPLMTGTVRFQTRFELPPGERDVVEKLRLDGRFGVSSARFTNFSVQNKVDEFSRKGKGEPEQTNGGSVVSELKGRFLLENGGLQFRQLSFVIPGASVDLSGTYGLVNGQIDFRGKVRLAAKLSETTTGVKSFLLKMVDPLFKKKNAGAVIPIRITGTREKPSFGLDVGGLVGK